MSSPQEAGSQQTPEIPGIERFAGNTNAQTAYRNAYTRMEEALRKSFAFMGSLPPDTLAVLSSTAALYATGRAEPYLNQELSPLKLSELDVARIQILTEFTSPEEREAVKGLVGEIFRVAETIIAEHDWSRVPNSQNFAGHIWGENPQAKYLRVAQQTGVMLYDSYGQARPGNICLDFDYVSEFKTTSESQGRQYVGYDGDNFRAFLQDFMNRLFAPTPNKQIHTSSEYFFGRWHNAPFTHRDKPFVANFVSDGSDSSRRHPHSQYYRKGIVISLKNFSRAILDEYNKRELAWREEQKRMEQGKPLLDLR